MFNPQARVSLIEAAPDLRVWVVDDALAEPDRWVERASLQRHAFVHSGKDAYPGLQLELPDAVSGRLDEVFSRVCRSALGARRTLGVFSRLALVTKQPEELEPRQWLCHRDRLAVPPGQCVAASVLYLFRDPALGGTGFYRARRSEAETARLVHDSGQLDGAAFTARYGVAAGYMSADNDWFEKVLSVEPRWNRMILYDGALFHSSDIPHPERLSDDPARGRLTLNGFFTCRRSAT